MKVGRERERERWTWKRELESFLILLTKNFKSKFPFSCSTKLESSFLRSAHFRKATFNTCYTFRSRSSYLQNFLMVHPSLNEHTHTHTHTLSNTCMQTQSWRQKTFRNHFSSIWKKHKRFFPLSKNCQRF
jgi:hypothetical protein